MAEQAKYRLVTRSDFDGLVCAVLLKEIGMIDEVIFVHPKDMQDGKLEVTSRDITSNVPYLEGCHFAFDHHASELRRLEGMAARGLSTLIFSSESSPARHRRPGSHWRQPGQLS